MNMANNTFRCPHDYVSYAPDAVQKAYASYIVNIVFNSVFCLPAAFVNALVIVAVFTSPRLKTKPSNLLLCSLAFTDLGVGLVAQPLHVASRAAEVVGDSPTYCVTWLVSRVVGRWLSNASLYTLAAISVDRVLAIHLKTRYRTVVSSKRIAAVLVVVGCVAALIACVRLFATVGNFLLVVACSYLFCLGLMFLAYMKSFQALRVHQKNVQQHGGSAAINVAGYQRSLHTMLLIVGCSLLFYLPFICLSTYLAFTGRNPVERAAWTIVDLLVFMNSVVNPLFYYWRIPDFRRAIQDILRKCSRQLKLTAVEPDHSTSAENTDTTNTRPVEPTGLVSESTLAGCDIE